MIALAIALGGPSCNQDGPPGPPTDSSARDTTLAEGGAGLDAPASPPDGNRAEQRTARDARSEAQPVATVKIPASSDWTDKGPILSAGAAGAWDQYLWGGFGGAALKKNKTFYLYYQGAKDYSTTYDTVTYRAIGVAVSSDGKTFTKHSANPVLKWFPTNNLEEGAVSTGALLSPAGEIVIYYGANTAISSTLINGDGRAATSIDGLTFVDKGLVLDHKSTTLWGAGDEIFPVAALVDQSQWFVYYLPNGTPQSRQLGVAWGPSMNSLPKSAAALTAGKPVSAWGMAGSAILGDGTIALFVSDVGQKFIRAYTMMPKVPNQLTGPVATYVFPNMSQGTVLLDRDSATWFLFYRNQDATSYGVRTAPVSYQ